jgi:hypothetical protein
MLAGANWMFFSIAAGLGSCIGMLLLAYNVIAVAMFMREDTDGASSGMAKAAWGVGVLSLFFSMTPCFGVLLPLVAIILSRVERGRIYRDESPLAGATPVRMGSVNGGVALLIWLITTAGMMASMLISSAPAG